MSDILYSNWWSPDGKGEAADCCFEKANQSSDIYLGMGVGVERPTDHVHPPAQYDFVGRGFYPEIPNSDTSLTITLMMLGGFAGCIGVVAFHMVRMALQIVGWAA